MDECAGHVCEWERACLPAGHAGAGSPGSPGGVAAATTAAQPSTALMNVQVWGGSHFEELQISSLRRSLWNTNTLVPRCVSVPSALGRAVHTATRSQGPGTVVLTGEEAVASPTLSTMETSNKTESG